MRKHTSPEEELACEKCGKKDRAYTGWRIYLAGMDEPFWLCRGHYDDFLALVGKWLNARKA